MAVRGRAAVAGYSLFFGGCLPLRAAGFAGIRRTVTERGVSWTVGGVLRWKKGGLFGEIQR